MVVWVLCKWFYKPFSAKSRKDFRIIDIKSWDFSHNLRFLRWQMVGKLKKATHKTLEQYFLSHTEIFCFNKIFSKWKNSKILSYHRLALHFWTFNNDWFSIKLQWLQHDLIRFIDIYLLVVLSIKSIRKNNTIILSIYITNLWKKYAKCLTTQDRNLFHILQHSHIFFFSCPLPYTRIEWNIK